MATIGEQEYITRIAALEKLNATLAAHVDRMRPVVEAAESRAMSLGEIHPDGLMDDEIVLVTRVRLYQQQMAQLAKER
jgi:hypothetical protein